MQFLSVKEDLNRQDVKPFPNLGSEGEAELIRKFDEVFVDDIPSGDSGRHKVVHSSYTSARILDVIQFESLFGITGSEIPLSSVPRELRKCY